MNERLEIYKIFVETITANEGRRQQAATAYLGIMAALFTAAWSIPDLPRLIPAIAVLVISITWFATVQYFLHLAQAKFAVIQEIEKEFSLPAFKLEWDYFNKHNGNGFLRLTRIEQVVPALAAIICAGYILCVAIQSI